MTDTLSSTDRKILQALQSDGKLTNVALAEQIGMSPSPCLRRVRQLEEAGYIAGYAAQLDRRKIGLGILAYVEIKVPQTGDATIIERFKKAVLAEPSIVGCYITAGQFDFLLKVVARDIDAYSHLVQQVLLKLPGVQDMRTTFALEAIKDSSHLPIP